MARTPLPITRSEFKARTLIVAAEMCATGDTVTLGIASSTCERLGLKYTHGLYNVALEALTDSPLFKRAGFFPGGGPVWKLVAA